MPITYRPETPADYPAIDAVNTQAFGHQDEANIVHLQRQYYPLYDPRYSLLACDGPTIVGHALWTPARLRLLGQTVLAVALGPIAVLPAYQKQGIGGELLRQGHALAKRDGYAFAFLCGHPTYYPRYGYKPAFGFAKVTVNVDALPQPTRTLTPRPVTAADVPWLTERLAAELAHVDFGWLWGSALTEWAFPPINSFIYWTSDHRRAAYILSTPGRNKAKLLLADDPELALDALATRRPATLEHHPAGWLARHVLRPEWSKTEVHAHDAAMAFELQEGVLHPYLTAIARQERPIGATLFPLPFLAC